MVRGGTVYILTNSNNTVLYTGVTSDLVARIQQHQLKIYPKSFTSKYRVDKLVYYQNYPTVSEAIAEEKRIKGGSRMKKIKLIHSQNPTWKDLWEEIKTW